jgi:hypothetical protein
LLKEVYVRHHIVSLMVTLASVGPFVAAPVPPPKPAPARPLDVKRQILAALAKEGAYVGPTLSLRVERMEGTTLQGVCVEVKGVFSAKAQEAVVLADGAKLLLRLRAGQGEYVSHAQRARCYFMDKSLELPLPKAAHGRDR